MRLADSLIRICALVLLSGSFVASALRCRCTKESETVTCVDGACEVDNGSCLMLDHPTMGVHYTCHRFLMNDTCKVKTSKSGADVEICGCISGDMCNFKRWGERSARNAASSSSAITGGSASIGSLLPPILTLFLSSMALSRVQR